MTGGDDDKAGDTDGDTAEDMDGDTEELLVS